VADDLLVGNPWTRWRRGVAVTAVFAFLTALMTWPQAAVLSTHAVSDQDVFFNMWRLGWIAHALSTSPAELFNANIFYPERGVLAYSDAMLVEGVLAAPLLWAGLPPVLVHNLMLLGAIVASAVGMFALARHVTGSSVGGLVAGLIIAFAPYRFDHYIHLELQWIVWSPWAFWALQRAIETGSVKFGVLTGLFVSLQLASSVYYGVFLGILIAPVALTRLITLRGHHLVRSARNIGIAGVIAASLAGMYQLPYSAAASRVGTRTEHEATMFSARPRDYTAATPTNLVYGSPETMPERRLFPGVLPLLLAMIGLLLVPPTTAAISYLVGLIVAFELSLGFFGLVYPWLYEHVSVLRGLRAPARASVFCLMFLGVLAAYGAAALTASLTRARQAVAAVFMCAILLIEYRVAPLQLEPYHNEPPALYSMLARLPRGVVAEFPMPAAGSPPGHDPRFAYMSTFHWMPLVNGYSGFYPPSYLERLKRLSGFPDARWVAALRSEGVRYVIVHADGYPPGERVRIVERLLQLGLKGLGEFEDGWSMGTIMELQ
jgi:hypothetical protein